MITLRFLVSNASVATDAFFAPVRGRDYGVLARFAWIGAALLIVGVGLFLTANAWRTVVMVG